MYIDFGNPENTAIRGIQVLPKNMEPTQEAFEKVGFVFENIEHRIFFKAQLPKGWKKNDCDYLVDKNNAERGSIRVMSNRGYQKARMCLFTRFYIDEMEPSVKDDWCSPFHIVVRDRRNGKSIVFCSIATYPSFDLDADAHEKCYAKAKEEVMEFLEKNYPDWADCTKYWD